MKRAIVLLTLLFFVVGQLSACASRVVYVPKKPPAKKVVVVKGPKPSPKAIWVAGYWKWNAKKQDFVWVKGHWSVPPKGKKVWVPGHWVKKKRGWVYVKGHWK